MLSLLGKKADLYRRDDPDWVPSLNMVPVKAAQKSGENSLAIRRFERCQRREEQRKATETESWDEGLSDNLEATETDSFTNNLYTQTDIDNDALTAMESELQALQAKNTQLHEQIKSNNKNFDVSSFKDNNEKVLFFTGIQTWHILFTLYSYLSPYLSTQRSLNGFQMLIMTLMKLRLNISNVFLAYLFGLSSSTVSRILTEMIDIMFIRMKPLILWPSREALWKTMPLQFQEHFALNVAVIIDCFEIFIERPSNLKARAETWSSYKHHNTIKYLIGITPQGTVSFISNGWGGRASDKYITENCGFLNKILPGDIVLADRGFNIQDSIGCKMAEVKIPAFRKGKKQLSPLDVEQTRHIASVRIHVERVIGCVRQKYCILNGPLPIDFLIKRETDALSLIDKIVYVCCACVNLSESVVNFM